MTALGSENAVLDFDGPIATITLNRPACFNAVDTATAAVLRRCGETLAGREDVRVIVIRGAGTAFSVGGDITMMLDHLDDLDGLETEVRRLLTDLHIFLDVLRRSPSIVVTSVHGAVAGGGFSLALAGDLCIAADTARFSPAYAKLGLSPDAGGSAALVEAVGLRRAKQIIFMEESFSAEHAESWGLVSRVYPEKELIEATDVLALRLAGLSSHAVAATKRLLGVALSTPIVQQLEDEMNELIGCMRTLPFRQEVESFIKKRR